MQFRWSGAGLDGSTPAAESRTEQPGAAGDCFCAGTRIATPDGEVAIEGLRAGRRVLTLDGGALVPQPVRWVGRIGVDLMRHPAPSRAAPIRILADAFGPKLPRRDLLVSPDHGLLVDGVLMHAQSLVNGATIVREPPAGRVVYWHVELDRHALLLAEGLPAESFLDTGNRSDFEGEAGVRPLYADLAAARLRSREACASLVLTGPMVTAAHKRLLRRASALGHRLSADPRLEVFADGVEVRFVRLGPTKVHVTLPEGTTAIRLASRSFVPDEVDGAADDRRRLGIAVAALAIDGMPLPADAYAAGWHLAQAGGPCRWTTGDALVRIEPRAAVCAFDIRLADVVPRYWASLPGAGLLTPRAPKSPSDAATGQTPRRH